MNQRLSNTVTALVADFGHDVVEATNIGIALEGLETFLGQATLIFKRCRTRDLAKAREWLEAHGYAADPTRLKHAS